ncbi:TraM recognition domain-containing protein [Chromobacterium sp. CV08]|uniref:TraM recognition domain-containing protein n=1 Tax=Chromobacterium sp. CV08 TaxID=3133274 RepID=UPI003DA7C66C
MRRSQVERDVVPLSHKIFGWIRRNEPGFLAAAGIAYLLCPIFPLATAAAVGAALLMARNKVVDHPKGPFWRPVAGGDKKLAWTRMEGPPDKGGKGVWCMGNAMDTKEEIWVSDDTMRVHATLFGTTGGGKTVALEGLICQAIGHGSGVIMVDGKSDPKTWFDIVTMAKMYGREDDLLVLNFISSTGYEKLAVLDEDDADGARGKMDLLGQIHSNTFNPFTYGSADTLTELVTGLMRPDGGGDGAMWRGRAEAMIRSLMRGLVALRDAGKVTLSVQVLRDYMRLDKLGELEGDDSIPAYAREQLTGYLDELPGFREAMKAKQDDPSAFDTYWEQASKQHGFLTMQFTELLGLLSGTYGHICNVEWGDVDFQDVVYNRRILYVMLPALEKAPSSLANLGRLTVAGIKNALSVSLKAQLTGSKQDIVDSRPTNSDTALLAIMDEYGSYAVEGFGDVAAQARSLGVSVIFAGQDYPSFKKGSEIEASRILANTGMKIFLKTEDQETADIAIKRAGQGVYAWAGGKRLSEGSDRLVDTGDASYREENRLTYLDLVDLAEGQAWFMNRNHLIKMNTFYVQLDGAVTKEAKHNTLFPLGTDLSRELAASKIMQQVMGAEPAASDGVMRFQRRVFDDVEAWLRLAELREIPVGGEADAPPAEAVDDPFGQISLLQAEHRQLSRAALVAQLVSEVGADVAMADRMAARDEAALGARMSAAELADYAGSLLEQALLESGAGGAVEAEAEASDDALPLTGFSAAAFFQATTEEGRSLEHPGEAEASELEEDDGEWGLADLAGFFGAEPETGSEEGSGEPHPLREACDELVAEAESLEAMARVADLVAECLAGVMTDGGEDEMDAEAGSLLASEHAGEFLALLLAEAAG